MTTVRTPDEDSNLALVKSYVENQGRKFADVLDFAEWDILVDYDAELTCFRVKDKRTFPHHGVSVALDTDALHLFERGQLSQLVGGVILEHLEVGLPIKETKKSYFTVVLQE